MYVDSELRFSNAQDVSNNDGTSAYSTNWIDLISPITQRDVGNGIPLYVVAVVTTAFVGTSSTLDIDLLSDATNAVADSGSTVHVTLGHFAAVAAAGTTLIMPFPPLQDSENTILRYVSLRYTPRDANLTTGNVTAFITNTPQQYFSYDQGYAIS